MTDASNSSDRLLVVAGIPGQTRAQTAPREADPGRREFINQGWTDRALCKDDDPDVFFSTDLGNLALASEICKRCPVKWECAQLGSETLERFGIWGGRDRNSKDPKKRKVLLSNIVAMDGSLSQPA